MNWTEDQLAERNRLVFPEARPAPLKPTGRQISEAIIEAECTKILECDGWRALRTDPVSDRSKGKGFGEIGMADHLYIRYGAETQVMWIEFKAPGGKPKKHQVDWHSKERARGALTLIAGEDFPASIDGFREWYRNSGLDRSR